MPPLDSLRLEIGVFISNPCAGLPRLGRWSLLPAGILGYADGKEPELPTIRRIELCDQMGRMGSSASQSH